MPHGHKHRESQRTRPGESTTEQAPDSAQLAPTHISTWRYPFRPQLAALKASSPMQAVALRASPARTLRLELSAGACSACLCNAVKVKRPTGRGLRALVSFERSPTRASRLLTALLPWSHVPSPPTFQGLGVLRTASWQSQPLVDSCGPGCRLSHVRAEVTHQLSTSLAPAGAGASSTSTRLCSTRAIAALRSSDLWLRTLIGHAVAAAPAMRADTPQ